MTSMSLAKVTRSEKCLSRSPTREMKALADQERIKVRLHRGAANIQLAPNRSGYLAGMRCVCDGFAPRIPSAWGMYASRIERASMIDGSSAISSG